LRRLVNKTFTSRMVQGMAEDIERMVDELVTRMAGRDVVDRVDDFAVPLPLWIIYRMLGVSEPDREQFHTLTARFVAGVGGSSPATFIRVIPTARKLLKMIERMANGEWRMADGGWRMANGEWRTIGVTRPTMG
jgi:cytochrome P450